MPHQKSADHQSFRLQFNPKSVIRLSAVLFALFAVLLPAAQAVDVTVGWDSNPEPDLEGYVIYRSLGYPGPPFFYSDTLPEDELTDPLHPKATLTGLREGVMYFIALTAYNTDGVESRFSNPVCVEVVNGAIETCSISLYGVASSRSGSGGSNGSACFISSSSGESSMFSNFAAGPDAPGRVITVTVLLLILITAVKLKKLKAGS